MAGRQLNIRLRAESRDTLEALALLRRVPSSVLARDVIEEFLRVHTNEPGLADVLRGLAKHDAAESVPVNVTRLRH